MDGQGPWEDGSLLEFRTSNPEGLRYNEERGGLQEVEWTVRTDVRDGTGRAEQQ